MSKRVRTLLVAGVTVLGVGAFLYWPRVEAPAPVADQGEPLVALPRPVVADNAAPAAPTAAIEKPAAPPPVQLVEATAKAAPAARPTPVARKRAPSLLGGDFAGGETAGDPAAVDRHLAAHAPAELQLLGILARNEIAAPPALDRLFAMKRSGAAAAELYAFMRRELPADVELRRHVVRWIEGEQHRAAVEIDTKGRTPLGTIEPATPAR